MVEIHVWSRSMGSYHLYVVLTQPMAIDRNSENVFQTLAQGIDLEQ